MRTDWIKSKAKAVLPGPAKRWLKQFSFRPPVGMVRFGSLRRVTPISRGFGFDRGRPIDRYYIENFLARHRDDIRGHVLEISEDTYTRNFGGDRVTKSDILHVSAENPEATIVADLTSADHIPSEVFDCIIFTQTLQYISDVRAALKTLYRILTPGGALLVTSHGISQICRLDTESWGEWWRITRLSAQRLFEEIFPPDHVRVHCYGNVLVAVAFLHGLATAELTKAELDYHDPDYEMLITVRAVKPAATQEVSSDQRTLAAVGGVYREVVSR